MFDVFFSSIVNSPFFGIVLSVVTYYIGIKIKERFNYSIMNPMIIAMILCIAFLKIFNISYEAYSVGGDMIFMFLAPMTAILAVSVYNRLETLKKNFLPIVIGTLVGSVAAVGSIYVMCRLFGLDEAVSASFYPKSVTTAISLPLSQMGGGIIAITFASGAITGQMGAIAAPFMAKIFGLKDSTAIGIAIGTSTHALGTTRAFQMGETEGAMSSIAIALAGVSTVLLYTIFGLV